jgi:WD40 repeat protein
VSTLRLLGPSPAAVKHDGDVLACAFSPDSAFVLTAGWDGFLRLWDVNLGTPVAGVQADTRPVSACAVSPDGAHWLSGSLDGLLGRWEATTQERVSLFLAHTRPVSGLRFAPDGGLLATASWDRGLTVWPARQPGQGRPLGSHGDIVAGCAFTPDGKQLVSWSYDGTACAWDVARGCLAVEMKGHADRVTAGGVSPDGRWLVTGSRDGAVKLWALEDGREAKTFVGPAQEVRACLFLRDAESVVVVRTGGRLTVHGMPDLDVRSELETGLAVQCADVAPSGALLALGCGDGRLCLVAVEGFDTAPLAITATEERRPSTGLLRRLLGQKARPTAVYLCTCPACRQSFELPRTAGEEPAACPGCRRRVRICVVTPALQG